MSWLDVILKLFGKNLDDIKGIIQVLTKKHADKKIIKAKVLFELGLNADALIEDYAKSGVNEKSIIKRLRNDALGEARDNGFNFNELKPPGRLKSNDMPQEGFLLRYENNDLNQLLTNIDIKITGLKEALTQYEEQDISKLSLGLRLKNLTKLILLVVTFLNPRVPKKAQIKKKPSRKEIP